MWFLFQLISLHGACWILLEFIKAEVEKGEAEKLSSIFAWHE